jgi:hypothetical protein
MPGPDKSWENHFTPREIQEIKFAEIYAKDFAHGTTGHNALMIIAKMAALLNGQKPAAAK